MSDQPTSHNREHPPSLANEIRPYLDSNEVEATDRFGEQLADRPRPRPGFRAELNAHLRELIQRERPRWEPIYLGRLAVAYLASGLGLIAVAAIGLGGAGPLG